MVEEITDRKKSHLIGRQIIAVGYGDINGCGYVKLDDGSVLYLDISEEVII